MPWRPFASFPPCLFGKSILTSHLPPHFGASSDQNTTSIVLGAKARPWTSPALGVFWIESEPCPAAVHQLSVLCLTRILLWSLKCIYDASVQYYMQAWSLIILSAFLLLRVKTLSSSLSQDGCLATPPSFPFEHQCQYLRRQSKVSHCPQLSTINIGVSIRKISKASTRIRPR